MKKILCVLFCLLLFTGLASAQSVGSSKTINIAISGLDTTPDYSSGDLVGDKITITNVFRLNWNSGLIQELTITDKANNAGLYRIWLFDSDPSSTTFTDNAAFSIADADLEKVIPCGPLDLTEVASTGSAGSFSSASALTCAIKLASANTLYMAIEAKSTINIADADDLNARMGVLED